ncbi:hypothetical protein [Methylobacterium soli]|uniref:Uncharacterized protein n=1 Tax=Methylobacterium soli TaxID=553447 RepID=A0A6L3SZG9_9HYPH|nr:hypothetical protein [Methylobacterium soli]KAB1077592.1 hypothetical protein F6X53_17825 [Methylobacterium soli]GJE46232.1 hypothetical protein AEGHOMDF_5432 [Methylobacterium soli]
MTTERAIRANRQNALASTGPRTAAGRTRSAQNARKHGLAATDPNPDAPEETEHLATLIAGAHGGDAAILDAARAVAEAQFHLRRVQAFKGTLIREEVHALQAETGTDIASTLFPSADLLQKLARLERYERRAFSQRKSAVRRFAALICRL